MADEVTEESAESAETTAEVPVEQWLPHPDSDYIEWMDKRGLYVEDLTDEQRERYEQARAERDGEKPES